MTGSPDKPRPFTEPDWMKEDPEFRAWVDSMPDKYWAKYDLGACHLGWFAARERTPASTPPNGHCSLNVAQGTQCALAGHCIGDEPTIQNSAASAPSATLPQRISVKAAFTLGDCGDAECSTEAELLAAIRKGLAASPIRQLLVEEMGATDDGVEKP